MNSREEIKKIVENTPNVASRMVKSRYPNVFKQIIKLKGNTTSEKIFIYLNGEPIGCKKCGNPTKFQTQKKGFQTYCGQKCMAIDTADKRKQSAQKTFMEKYGVTSPSQLQSTKDKIKKHRKDGRYDNVKEKIKQTKFEKYGDENYNNLELGKQTKLENYGDENFNNRDKFKSTMFEKYGDYVSPNVSKTTKERIESGEIGFGSEKFKSWLDDQNVENVSQLESVKIKKRNLKLKSTFEYTLERIKEYVEPLFDIHDFDGVGYYDTKYKFKCNKCESEFHDHLYSGNIPRCETCFPKKNYSSVGEYDVLYFIKELIPDVEIRHKDKKTIGKELDIYIPSKNLAIEFNGIFWHSEKHGGKSKEYHLEKTNLCKEKGIKLIHILDLDWMYKKNIIQSRLKHQLGKNTDSRIYARDCEIKEISPNQKSEFLNEYHIQGNDKAQIRLGLFNGGELLSVMTFGSLRIGLGHKNKDATKYELYRFCSKMNVIGGAGKLFKHFIKNYNPSEVITYSDIRWGYTDFYSKIGFTFDTQTKPNYWYFNNRKYRKTLYHRSSFQKHKLPKLLENFDPNLTEWQNMQLNGYDRIWDCGNLKFTWNK